MSNQKIQEKIDEYLKTSNWKRYFDEKKGKYYYYDKLSKKTQWNCPSPIRDYEQELINNENNMSKELELQEEKQETKQPPITVADTSSLGKRPNVGYLDDEEEEEHPNKISSSFKNSMTANNFETTDNYRVEKSISEDTVELKQAEIEVHGTPYQDEISHKYDGDESVGSKGFNDYADTMDEEELQLRRIENEKNDLRDVLSKKDSILEPNAISNAKKLMSEYSEPPKGVVGLLGSSYVGYPYLNHILFHINFYCNNLPGGKDSLSFSNAKDWEDSFESFANEKIIEAFGKLIELKFNMKVMDSLVPNLEEDPPVWLTKLLKYEKICQSFKNLESKFPSSNFLKFIEQVKSTLASTPSELNNSDSSNKDLTELANSNNLFINSLTICSLRKLLFTSFLKAITSSNTESSTYIDLIQSIKEMIQSHEGAYLLFKNILGTIEDFTNQRIIDLNLSDSTEEGKNENILDDAIETYQQLDRLNNLHQWCQKLLNLSPKFCENIKFSRFSSIINLDSPLLKEIEDVCGTSKCSQDNLNTLIQLISPALVDPYVNLNFELINLIDDINFLNILITDSFSTVSNQIRESYLNIISFSDLSSVWFHKALHFLPQIRIISSDIPVFEASLKSLLLPKLIENQKLTFSQLSSLNQSLIDILDIEKFSTEKLNILFQLVSAKPITCCYFLKWIHFFTTIAKSSPDSNENEIDESQLGENYKLIKSSIEVMLSKSTIVKLVSMITKCLKDLIPKKILEGKFIFEAIIQVFSLVDLFRVTDNRSLVYVTSSKKQLYNTLLDLMFTGECVKEILQYFVQTLPTLDNISLSGILKTTTLISPEIFGENLENFLNLLTLPSIQTAMSQSHFERQSINQLRNLINSSNLKLSDSVPSFQSKITELSDLLTRLAK